MIFIQEKKKQESLLKLKKSYDQNMEKEDLYYSLGGALMIIIGWLLLKSAIKWVKEEIKKPISISLSNAIGGLIAGVAMMFFGLIFIFQWFILPLYNWLKY